MKCNLFTSARRFAYLGLLYGIIVALTTACIDHTEPQQPQQSCRIASKISNANTETWEYTIDGQPKRYQSLTDGKIDYVYNANQLLIANTNTNRDGSIRSVGTFEYQNSRLVKWVVKSSSGDTLESRTLEYDGSGNLSRYIDMYEKSVRETYLFSNGKLTAHTIQFLDASGNFQDSPEIYTYENGLLKTIRNTGNGQTTTFLRDAQGRSVRSETRGADTLARYYITEYTDGNSEYEAYVLPKGWPKELRYYPTVYREYLAPDDIDLRSLVAKYAAYGAPEVLVPPTRLTQEGTANYTKNRNGLPVEKNSVDKGETYLAGFDQSHKLTYLIITPFNNTSKIKYTYVGCQE